MTGTAPPEGPLPARGGLGRLATEEQFSLADAVGGPRGLVEAVVPGVVFVAVFTPTHRLGVSAVAALASAAVLVLARLVARLPLAPAASGVVGVGVCALTALRTGDAADFYSWGLLLNVAYALALAASTLPLPRVGPFPGGAVPAVGLLVGSARGQGFAWREDRLQRRAFTRLTWLWVALFVLRLLVQVPLYLAGAVTALGVARLVMGVPLFAVAAWVTWSAVRRLPPVEPGAAGAPPRSRPR